MTPLPLSDRIASVLARIEDYPDIDALLVCDDFRALLDKLLPGDHPAIAEAIDTFRESRVPAKALRLRVAAREITNYASMLEAATVKQNWIGAAGTITSLIVACVNYRNTIERASDELAPPNAKEE